MKPDGKWRLDSISIRSFRGVAGQQSLSFGGGSALLYGNNGVGKSTMALALQWTLFGRFPSGVLPNVGFKGFLGPVGGSKGASCGEVVFRRAGQTLTIRRDERAGKFLVKIGTKVFEGEEAECERDTLLGVDMDAFVRTVLLHQSRVRGLLLDEVKDRNHAIDMLLGVDAAQDLHDVLKVKAFLDAADGWRAAAESEQRRHDAQGELLKRQHESAVAQARESGFLNKDLNWSALRAHYEKLVADVHVLASRHEAPLSTLVAPASSIEAQRFATKVSKELNQIRSKAQSQVLLVQEGRRAEEIRSLLAEWDQRLNDRDEAGKLIVAGKAEFATLGGPERALEEADVKVERQEQLLTDLGQMHKLLTDARSALAVQREKTCPVCAQPVDVSRLDKDLESRIRSLSSGEVAEGRRLLATLKENRISLKAKLEKLADQEEHLRLAQNQMVKLRGQVATLIGVNTISESKVRQRLLENARRSSERCESLEKSVGFLADEIEGIASRAAELDGSLLAVILKREEMSRHAREEESIKRDHAASEKTATAMEGLGARVERIRLALLDAKEELASGRLKRARPRSLELYERLVRHPKFSSFDITTTARAKKVDYNFEVSVDGNRSTAREAKLVLSDGQITATAVGIFVGLAESAAHDLDLLFIDDPTQNLDLPCKEAMAKLMVEMAGRKQIVVSTHDEDFVSYLREHGFDKNALMFHIESWNGDPKIVSESKVF
jgi:energy-coupling factor transporter ATP-binding protein EcfA2